LVYSFILSILSLFLHTFSQDDFQFDPQIHTSYWSHHLILKFIFYT